jgi:molecular chaperone Hsp33
MAVSEAATAASRDALTPFVFEHTAIRGGVVALADTSRAILAAHDYPPPIARALGELLAAAALLAATLKLDGSLIVQLRGDGPLSLLVVECDDTLGMRATAQWSAERVSALGPDAGLVELAGGASRAQLAITLDPRGAGTLYQGIVELQGTSIAASIEHYLATSEQLDSRLLLRFDGGAAHGLLVQRLPGSSAADDDTWTAVAARLGEPGAAALVGEGEAPAVLRRLFPTHDVRMFRSRPARFACRCSRERAENALRIAGAAEVDAALAAEGHVEVTCEYCGRQYRFEPAAARALFDGPPRTRH